MNTPEKLSELAADLRAHVRYEYMPALARTSMDKAATAIEALQARAETAEAARKALAKGEPAAQHLTGSQLQLDFDGCEVGVSRQALEEVLTSHREALSAFQLPPEGEESSSVGIPFAPQKEPSADTRNLDCEPSSGDVSATKECPRCTGRGWFMVGHGELRGGENCPDCGATGRVGMSNEIAFRVTPLPAAPNGEDGR